jgi:ribonuclease HI
MTEAAKEAQWREFVENNAMSNDAGKAWKLVKSLNGTPKASNRNETLITNGREVAGSYAKAEVFAKFYAGVNRLNLNKHDRARERQVKQMLSRLAHDNTEESEDFHMSELQTAIGQMRSKSAAGADKIAPRFLKALGPVALDFLLNCINHSWRSSQCPQNWRNATIIPLHKKGKPASKLESFRPVSLTSCFAKTMERMVGNRLYHLTETNNWICDDQAGFRRLRGCEDQVIRLTQEISDGFEARPAKRTVLALLDYSKAYDKVWRYELIGHMIEIGVPARFVKWCKAFLTNRQANVRLDGSTCRYKLLSQGLPQGAVLSPLLFSLYINRVRSIIPAGLKVSMYADDIAIWATDNNKDEATRLVELGVNAIDAWSKRMKLPLNATKCEIGFFSSNTHEAKWKPKVSIGDQQLLINDNPTFLGIKYDRSLSFNAHTIEVCRRADSRARLLSLLTSTKWGWRKDSLRIVYQALCRSILDYCAAAWQPWLSKTNVMKLERVQNRALRTITGQHATTPIEALRREAGVESYTTVSNRLITIAYEKSLRLPSNNPRRETIEREVKHRIKSRDGFRVKASNLSLPVMTHNDTTRQNLPLLGHPPWSCRNNLKGVAGLIGGSGKDSQQQVLLKDTIDTIRARYSSCKYIIYTDGSAANGLYNGGSAAVITTGDIENPEVVETLMEKGRRITSSYETELTALHMAANWLNTNAKEDEVAICTDSYAAVTALDSSRMKSQDLIEVVSVLSQRPGRTFVQWVPGHTGLPGNELADAAANAAASSDAAPDPAITMKTATAAINRHYKDQIDPKWAEIYKKGFDKGTEALTRKEAVLLAQIRSGHCTKFAAYKAVISPGHDPICPRCKEGPETRSHWLLECPAITQQRITTLGCPTPDISILLENPIGVVALARLTLA